MWFIAEDEEISDRPCRCADGFHTSQTQKRTETAAHLARQTPGPLEIDSLYRGCSYRRWSVGGRRPRSAVPCGEGIPVELPASTLAKLEGHYERQDEFRRQFGPKYRTELKDATVSSSRIKMLVMMTMRA